MNNKTKKLNHQNNLLDEKVLPENQEIFTNMICYLRGSSISQYEIEVVRHDLTEMILSAQSRGESISTLFNGDYKEFCDEVIESLPAKTTKQKIIDGLDVICWVLSIIFAINIIISKDAISIIEALVKRNPVNWILTVSYGRVTTILLVVALAIVIVNRILKNAFDEGLKHKKILVFAGGTGCMLVLIMIAWFGKNLFFSVNFFVACAVTVLLFLIHKILASFSC